MLKILICIISVILAIVLLIAATIINKDSVLHFKKALEYYAEIDYKMHLKESHKSRMCRSYCKFPDTDITQEELDWKCANCPLNDL